MTLAELSLKRPVTAIMVFVSMTVVGLIAAFRLPLEQLPDVQFPFLRIYMPYPGSTPGEVERSITRPVEEALSTLSGIKRLYSASNADAAEISIDFHWGNDTAVKAVEARAKIDAIRKELPSDLPQYFVQKFDAAGFAVMDFAISSKRDLSNSYDLLDRHLKKPLERLPGVARVELWGVAPHEVQIEISPDRLSAAGVSLNALYQRLSTANFSASGGLIKEANLRYQVQPAGEWRSVDEVRNLAINDKGLKLSDIADVSLKPARLVAEQHLNLRPSVWVEIYKERQANMVEVNRRIRDEIDQIKQSPEMQDISIAVFDDQGGSVTDSLRQLGKAGLEGTLLSVIVLFFFLRDWPSTLMVSLAIPICFVITLGCMQMFGMSLNILSMMGLLLAVGMLVDNAVVAVESIYQYREQYPNDPWYCAVQGTQIVGVAIAAGTLASVIVFLPLVLRDKSETSIFLGQVAITMGIAHLVSWLVAVSLVPMLSAKLPPPKFIGRDTFISRLQQHYGKFVAVTLKHRRWTMVGLAALLVASFYPMTHTKQDMNGGGGGSKFMRLHYRFNAQYPLPEMRRGVSDIERWLDTHRAEFRIQHISSYFDEQGRANTFLILDDQSPGYDKPAIVESMRKQMPKLAYGDVEIGWGGGGGGSDKPSIEVTLSGDSNVVLQELADTLIPTLKKMPSLRDVRSSQAKGYPELSVRIDREKAKNYGFSANDIAQYVGIALRGYRLKDYHGDDMQAPVWLRFVGTDAQNLSDLADYKLQRADGAQIPLLSMVELGTQTAPVGIERVDRQTSYGIVANFTDGKTADDARKEIQAAMGSMQLPTGYRWSFGQNFQNDDDAQLTMLFNVLIALVLVYVVMCAMFESLIYPAAILTTFVFSVFGVFWLFWVTGTTFNIMSWIGVLILMGVVVNNGIVMIVHINQLRHEGMNRAIALAEGAKDRLRPILMTMGTTILGMVPLCVGNAAIGGDGPPYYPMARAIVGGLIFSTLVSLLVLPTIYSLLDDASLWIKRVLRDARARRWRTVS